MAKIAADPYVEKLLIPRRRIRLLLAGRNAEAAKDGSSLLCKSIDPRERGSALQGCSEKCRKIDASRAHEVTLSG